MGVARSVSGENVRLGRQPRTRLIVHGFSECIAAGSDLVCHSESIDVMSASYPTSSQTAEQRAHEPSMEEILASIRRIIADDQMIPLTRTSVPPRIDPEGAPIEGLPANSRNDRNPVATATLSPSPPVSVIKETPTVQSTLRSTLAGPDPVVNPTTMPMAATQVAATSAAEHPSLVSPATGASVNSAFNALATTVFLQNTSMVEEALRDLLKPLLKQWLDENLPNLVERLVRQEIERVARGGR